MEVKVTDWPESIVGLDGLIVGVVRNGFTATVLLDDIVFAPVESAKM